MHFQAIKVAHHLLLIN